MLNVVVQLMGVADIDVVSIALEALEAVLLKAPQEGGEEWISPQVDPYHVQIDELGGVDALERLQEVRTYAGVR